MIEITRSVIDLGKVVESVVTPESGGINVFLGTTRNHSKEKRVRMLEYEAYEPMAVRTMEKLAEIAKERWHAHRVSIVHRVGKVPIGEASVAIAVSSAHREEAFKACKFVIDELKRVVPIWKREHFADGTVEWSQHSHEQPASAELEK